MDVTERARALLEPVPAHRTAGIEVLRAADGAAQVALTTPYVLTNVIGSLHSGGLAALVDAVGPAAIIALRPVLAREKDRAALTTHAEVVDSAGVVVCRGSFDWSVRRTTHAPSE